MLVQLPTVAITVLSIASGSSLVFCPKLLLEPWNLQLISAVGDNEISKIIFLCNVVCNFCVFLVCLVCHAFRARGRRLQRRHQERQVQLLQPNYQALLLQSLKHLVFPYDDSIQRFHAL